MAALGRDPCPRPAGPPLTDPPLPRFRAASEGRDLVERREKRPALPHGLRRSSRAGAPRWVRAAREPLRAGRAVKSGQPTQL